ncbi:MAG: phage terminase large subunit family protein [Thermoleophilia bacterium]
MGGREFDFAGHEYLQGLYLDESPSLVIRKAAQMGASEYAISRALHFAVSKGGTVIYFFPSDHDVAEFSQDRFGPAISESEYLTGLVRETDTVGLKHIGAGSIYFRGTRSRTRMKSVPADFLIFDELDEMDPAKIELARKRLGHSSFGWELSLSTPSLPAYGIDAAFGESDQRFWLLRCPGCRHWWCLEDLFLEHHGSPSDPRREICFVQGAPGAETLVCVKCGRPLDPGLGQWVPKYPGRPSHGYHLSKFASVILSERERDAGAQTKPAALLAEWRRTSLPAEFFHSELGLPYLAADGGLRQQDLLALVGVYTQVDRGRGCVMGVDQGNGLHVVVKEPVGDEDLVCTVRVHYEPQTDATFTHLDYFMEAFDVRSCVIDALPNTHAARAFSRRYPGRVYLAYYGDTQKGLADWGADKERTPIVTISRTEAFDAWRDIYQQQKRRIPRVEGAVTEYVKQMTNILRTVTEDPASGAKRARWIKRGPDHFAHADNYAEVALCQRAGRGRISVLVIG